MVRFFRSQSSVPSPPQSADRKACYAEISRLPLVMRARIFLCITLLCLCHPQLWPQAVTNEFPLPSQLPQLPDAPDVPVARVVPAPPGGVPVEIRAISQREKDNVYTLEGNVVIHYRDYVIQADKIVY